MDMTAIVNQYGYMALNLFGVIILIFALMYILKKVKSSKIANNRDIKIINTVPIGTKEKIILIEVNNTVLLVGATPSHIETLYVFNESDPDNFMGNEHMDSIHSFSNEMSALKYSE